MYYTPVFVKHAVASFLLRSHGVESLEIGVQSETPFHLLACIPPTVKHLTDNGVFMDYEAHELRETFDPALPSVTLAVRSIELDTLTLTMAGGSSILQALLSHQSPISISSLKHLQIGECFNQCCFNATCARVISLCSTTLQCLHIGVSEYLADATSLTRPVANVPIPLGELRCLQILEIRTNVALLKRTLRWLSESIATIAVEERQAFTQRLKIILLFSHTAGCGCLPCLKSANLTKFTKFPLLNRKARVPPSWYLQFISNSIGENLEDEANSAIVPTQMAPSPTEWHQRFWEWTMGTGQENWPNVGLANVSLFLEHIDNETKDPLITEEPPMAFEHGDDHRSLWDGCPCSGWRYWQP
jgi:hypothetical protein